MAETRRCREAHSGLKAVIEADRKAAEEGTRYAADMEERLRSVRLADDEHAFTQAFFSAHTLQAIREQRGAAPEIGQQGKPAPSYDQLAASLVHIDQCSREAERVYCARRGEAL